MGLFESIFGTHSDHELKRINPLVDKVFSYEEEFAKLSDHDLAGKTDEFRAAKLGRITVEMPGRPLTEN